MNISAVTTIDRLVEILDYFAQGHTAVSLSELSEHLHLPKSTLHRFLFSLEAHGILRRDGNDKKWYPGYLLIVWGSVAAENTTIRDIAKPYLYDLAKETGEMAILTVYHAQEVICVDMVESNHPVRLNMRIGTQRAAHAGASSKILIASLPEQEIVSIVKNKGLQKLCTNTITELEALKIELATIREQGYAESLEETDYGAWGVATAIRDYRGQVVGGIGLAGPTLRYSKETIKRYASIIHGYAERISTAMSTGGLPSKPDHE
ncbi:MAG: IclR family transcriptional regulator [Chloroflexi bacterium]|nr:IclR family transcriptional regulator [Chloroflexota bacterium]